MKIIKFIIKNIFLKNLLTFFAVLSLIFVCNYMVFIGARSTVSTLQGYNEVKYFEQPNSFIANLDPSSETDMGKIRNEDTQKIYNHLNKWFKYALFSDGFVVPLANKDGMDVTVAYLNETYSKLTPQFEIVQGENLNFDYELEHSSEIPILLGAGLGKEYPIGSTIKIEDPALEEEVTLRVQGILKENTYRSNLYALSSKQYYNYSIILPVNERFLQQSKKGFQLQSLFDLMLLDTSKEKVRELATYLQTNLGLDFNFYTQKENVSDFSDDYFESIRFIMFIILSLVLVLSGITLWSSLLALRLNIKDFTVHLFVGLTYTRLRTVFYLYYFTLFFINFVLLFSLTSFSRYGSWLRKDSSFSTFGLFGLIEMDWLSLMAVGFFDLLLGVMIVEILLWKIRKIPISLGVYNE